MLASEEGGLSETFFSDHRKFVLVLPGKASPSVESVQQALEGQLGRHYVIQGELLRVWLVLQFSGPLSVRDEHFVNSLEVSIALHQDASDSSNALTSSQQVAEEGKEQRKAKHGWGNRGEENDGEDQGFRWTLLRCGWKWGHVGNGLIFAADVAIGASMKDLLLEAVVREGIMGYGEEEGSIIALRRALRGGGERVGRSREIKSPAVRMRKGLKVEAEGKALVASHCSTAAVIVELEQEDNNAQEDDSYHVTLHRATIAEGSARYHGPAGVQHVSLSDLFSVHVDDPCKNQQKDDQDSGLIIHPGDSYALLLTIRPKPQAYVQFTDLDGSFSARFVVSWSAPQVRGFVLSWRDVFWHGPRSNDLLVALQSPPHMRTGELFSVEATVNNISDLARTLTLSIGSIRMMGVEGGHDAGGLICMDNSVMVGTLTPKSKAMVVLRFVAMRPGLYEIKDIKLTDVRETHILAEPWIIRVED